jgi:hypothetical protein
MKLKNQRKNHSLFRLSGPFGTGSAAEEGKAEAAKRKPYRASIKKKAEAGVVLVKKLVLLTSTTPAIVY